MKVIALIALSAGILAAQDEARISDLIKKLGDTEYAEREKAKAELAKIGAPALKDLEAATQSPDPEVVQSARDLIEKIRRTQLVQGVLKAGAKVTLSLKDGTFEEAAKAIEGATGVQVRVPETLKTVRVSLDVQDAELLRVLDILARQIKETTYRFDGNAVVFGEGKFVDVPAAYKGPFKFSITRIRTTTDNEFSRRTSSVDVTIATEWEPGSKPTEHTVRIVEAVDPSGKKFAPPTEVEPGAGGMQSVSSMTVNGKTIRVINDGGNVRVVTEDADGPDQGKTVSLRDIPSAAAKFQTLRCIASFVIPTAVKKEVVFAKPVVGATQIAGDVEIAIEEIDEDAIRFSLKGRNGEKIGADLLDKNSFVVKSGEKEYEAELQDPGREGWDGKNVQKMIRRVQRVQRQGGDASHFSIAIPKHARENGVDSLKFSVKEVVHHQVEFEFKDLDLR